MTEVKGEMAKRDRPLLGRQSWIVFFSVLQLAGCSLPLLGGYGSEGRSKAEFAQYVEEVFKRQNNVTSQIMILMENGDITAQQPILKAEQHMHELCSPITEYASREIDGLNKGLWLQRRVEKSAEDCGKAAHEVELMLNQF